MPREIPNNPLDAQYVLSCNASPVSQPFALSCPDSESPHHKRGTCEPSEPVAEDSRGAVSLPCSGSVSPSASPDRKKSRVICSKENLSEPFVANHPRFNESYQVPGDAPSVFCESCVTSCCSDEDNPSPINFIDMPFEREDLVETQTLIEETRCPESPCSGEKNKSTSELGYLMNMEERREKTFNEQETSSIMGEASSLFSTPVYANCPTERNNYHVSVANSDYVQARDPFFYLNSDSYSKHHGIHNGLPSHYPQPSYEAKDFSCLRNLPPVRENEIEFVIDDFAKYRKDFSTSDRLWSPSKTYKSVSFRLLVFPRGNKTVRLSNLSAYLAVDPSEAFPPHFKSMWYMHHCNYMIIALHWGNWKDKSICKMEHFSFSSEDVDRGWLDFIPQEALVEGQFIGPAGQLVLRAQICPRVVAAGNQHFLSRKDVGYIGIRNQGATCYLNSLVQALYHIGEFRRSIFELTKETDEAFTKNLLSQTASNQASVKDDENTGCRGDGSAPWTEAEIRETLQNGSYDRLCDYKSESDSYRLKVSLALQELFLKLSLSNEVVSTDDLIRSFGWESNESLTQHDAQELNRLLCDRLEEQMKGTPSEGVIERLFMGEFENYVQCIDVPYSSTRRETFYDLQLDVQNTHDVYESLNKYIEEEVLEGDNLYDAENYGRQRARKGVRFIRFPPVIQFHLKRFTFDPLRMDMVKINQRFEYPQTLDISKILPGAGLYELFCVIVHGGDVGGGHYYVINRPGGKEWWMRFDDEKVYFVSRDSAFEDSYGGRNSVCFDYINDYHDTRYKSIDMSVKLHSAYILFYVRADRAKEILEEPDPNVVNPHLLRRVEWEESNRQKRTEIRNYVKNTVVVRFITEYSLREYHDFLNDYASLPACYERRFPQAMTILDLWKTIENKVEKQELKDPLLADTRTIHYFGLWFFDAVPNCSSPTELDIRPLPLQLGECSKHESTLGDYLNRISRVLRKPWAPTLCFLIHPIFSKRKSEIRSVGALQNAINSTKFFIGKFFSPGRSHDVRSSNQSLVVAGFPFLKLSSVWKGPHPLLVLFVELLRTFLDTEASRVFQEVDIEEFVQESLKTYLPSNTGAAPLSMNDPLHIIDRIYLESGKSFQYLPPDNPSQVIDTLQSMPAYRTDETFPPIIVFALPPSPKALELHKQAYAYGVPPNDLDIYEEDTEYEEIHQTSKRRVNETCAVVETSQTTRFQSGELKLPDIVSKNNSPLNEVTASTKRFYQCDKTGDALVMTTSSISNSPLLAAPRYPPRVPFFPSCTPVEWHASLMNSKITISLKLYDPIAVISRWENTSGHPLDTSMLDDYPQTLVEPTTPSSDVPNSARRLSRCPPLKVVDVHVDFRWPYRLALRWLCWHLGVNADYCLIQPAPPLSIKECPTFTTHLSPSEAEYLSSIYTWSPERSEYISNEFAAQKPTMPVDRAIRLEELHNYFTQRYRLMCPREINGTSKGPAHSIVSYHVCLLPRRVMDPTLGFMQSEFIHTKSPVVPLDDGSRLILVKVFNKNVQNVGSVLVEFNKNTPTLVSKFIEKIKESITPCMEAKGAMKSLTYRLVWEGAPYSGIKSSHQITLPPSRLDIITDELLTSRLSTLTLGFQFASPLRLEPDFTEVELRSLSSATSLPPFMTLAEQIASNRTLCLTVVHQNRDHQFFGHPFYILISSSDTLRMIKDKMLQLLQIPHIEFSKWKFFVFDYEHISFIRDDEVPDFSRGKPVCFLAVHKYFYAPEERVKTAQLHIK